MLLEGEKTSLSFDVWQLHAGPTLGANLAQGLGSPRLFYPIWS